MRAAGCRVSRARVSELIGVARCGWRADLLADDMDVDSEHVRRCLLKLLQRTHVIVVVDGVQ